MPSKKYQSQLFAEYRERKAYLKSIGFDSYYVYLDSNRWKAIRRLHLKSAPWCQFCGKKSTLNVHHLEYTRITTKTNDYLITLCQDCHHFSHALHQAFPDLTIRKATLKAKVIKKYLLNAAKKERKAASRSVQLRKS